MNRTSQVVVCILISSLLITRGEHNTWTTDLDEYELDHYHTKGIKTEYIIAIFCCTVGFILYQNKKSSHERQRTSHVLIQNQLGPQATFVQSYSSDRNISVKKVKLLIVYMGAGFGVWSVLFLISVTRFFSPVMDLFFE
eukprot:TRINITY_DN3651_c0_g1_i1.p1 TRINITY_DN3651_c0_g1~~TRINITY_DN3651_c0_g1_i1.p1  ORF type:complete len:139 (-),score=7.91 TRINITY_DN3651_c0_g1_i1:27-443(-)